MLKSLKKYIFWLFLLFFADFEAFSYEKAKISDKLWQKVTKKDRRILRQIDIYLNSKRYDLALKVAKSFQAAKNKESDAENNPYSVNRQDLRDALQNIILWRKYSDFRVKGLSFNDVSRFVMDNEFYPNISDLRRRVEGLAIDNEVAYRLSERYFLSYPALSLRAKLYLIESKSDYLLQLQGDDAVKQKVADEIQEMIVATFVDADFDEEREADFLQKYAGFLTKENYRQRVERLLFDGSFLDARRMFKFVGQDHVKLYEAVMKIRKLPKYIKKIVLSVPRRLRKDENLIYARALWRKSRGEIDDVVDLMLDLGKMKYPEKWWSLRRLYARELLKTKDYRDSYYLISRHGLSPNFKYYWEAEWMSGWISLRFLGKGAVSYKHFNNLYENVRQPVTLARATYWLGMSSLEMGEKNRAIKWFEEAAHYPLYFYGQLAIHKLKKIDPKNHQEDVILPEDPEVRVVDAREISDSMSAKVAYLLALMGRNKMATKIFDYGVLNAGKGGEGRIAVLMRLVNEVGSREMEAKVSRMAAKRNVFFVRDKFQIVKEVKDSKYAPLVHAIIKQESGFAPTALSSVGAVGFMQIMPDTAKMVAKDLGVRYNRRRLSRDIKYNVKLGSHYIKSLVDKFDGSQMLAIAAYNAGPHNAKRWIEEFYDPREEEDVDKVVDWVELITYSETRNYVQRITENLIVYKYLMAQ